MEEKHTPDSLETVLEKLENEADGLVKAAGQLMGTFKNLRRAASAGNAGPLRKSLDEARKSLVSLGNYVDHAHRQWDYYETSYLVGSGYRDELLAKAKSMGVDMFEHDGSFYAHPVVLRMQPKEQAMMMNRVRETRLRPSVLLSRLKELQSKPLRFRPQGFLEVLYSAYAVAVATRGKHLIGTGLVVPLVELYDLLTLLPWQSTEYPRTEYARDIYLLDRSGASLTKQRSRLNFHASTGIRDASKTLTMITQGGRMRTYYGISFVREE